MIKKVIIITLIIFSFTISIYTLMSGLPIDESIFGRKEVILFSIPFTLILVNSNLFVQPYFLKENALYNQYLIIIENIFCLFNTISCHHSILANFSSISLRIHYLINEILKIFKKEYIRKISMKYIIADLSNYFHN